MIDQKDKTESSPKAKPKFKNRLAYSMALALLMFAVIPVSIMGLAGYLRARSLIEKQVAFQIYNISNSQADAFNKSIKTKNIRLNRISNRPAFLEAAETLIETSSVSDEEILNKEFDAVNRPDGKPIFDEFFLINSEGIIYATSNKTWMGISLTESPDYALLTNGDSATALYNLSPVLPKQLAIFSIEPLKSETGKDLGLLIGLTKGETIRTFLNETTFFNPSTTAYIISANNIYVGIDPYTKQLTAFEPSQEQQGAIYIFSKSPLTGEEAVYHLLNFENNLEVAVVAQAHQIDSINSQMILEVPRKIAFGQLGSLAPFSIYLFLGTLLVMGTVLWVASNRIVKPIHALSDVARNFSAGDWQARASEKRKDEIGELAHSFNQMADELSSLYRTLKYQVDERTEYIRTASDVAQSIVATFNLDELLEKTARLIVERFNYYHAGVFMVGNTGKTAYLKAAHGPAAKEMLKRKHHLDVGSNSIVGWVSANNQPRAASDVDEDAVYFQNELLPNTHAEVGIPISIGDTVLGVLDVQSSHPEAFDEATIAVLVTLSNQLATAVQNVSLFESSDVNLQELDRLYRASREIAQEKTRDGILEALRHILQDAPFSTAILIPNNQKTLIYSASDPDYNVSQFSLPDEINTPLASIIEPVTGDDNIIDVDSPPHFPRGFIDILKKIGSKAISLLPMTQEGNLEALIVIGARHKAHLTQTAVKPYVNLIEIVAITLDRIKAFEMTERRLTEMEAISITNQATAAARDLNSLYPALHEQVRQVLGEFSFVVALYDDISDTINIPYLYEAGKVGSIAPFPLGEGLTSIIIRTGQPLMIVEDTEKRAAALGAKLVGSPAKSWLGSPLQVQGKIIGAIIIQDTESENSFDENSLRFINTLASQVSGAIYNIQLLENSRKRAIQLESAAEIARDISGSLNLDELLNNAVTLIRERFNFYHASIFLIDPLGEYAIIREATGEAGIQLKRNGHKLAVGSKSIVGYVSNRGENLVIEDTNKDATYYANPLLPETRAEAAIPLKVGERILGVLDVQSVKPYAFPEEILQTLSIIADQLAVAVINTELFAETQEHLSQHRLLHHITTSAASGTTLEESLRGAVQGLQVTLGGDRVAILLVDKKEEKLIVGAAIGYSEDDIASIEIPIGDGVTGWVARNQKLLKIDDTHTDPRYISVSTNTRSELAIPLTFRKELLGVLNVESELTAAYDEHDEEMLGTLAGSLAAIIANSRLLQRARRQAERERMLYEVTSKIRRSTNVQTILATTAKEITKAVGAQHAQVKIDVRLDDNTNQRK